MRNGAITRIGSQNELRQHAAGKLSIFAKKETIISNSGKLFAYYLIDLFNP
ncbi:hypothetical protein RUESEDTHA_03824 [Ruegeria sp. THAF57]|nr:hypothetical protein RUESEDTHA_03824 [Ruegeria sp. THAF57]